MAWDEWEQLKQDAAARQDGGMQLNQLPPGDGGSGPAPSGVTGGLKSNQQAWNSAGDGVGGLRTGLDKALQQLTDGQAGLGPATGCRTVTAQKTVYDSWSRYVKDVGSRCDSVKELLHKVGNDLLKTDQSVQDAVAAIDTRFADTAAVGGQGK